jgi:hypothetical protein
MEVARIGSHRFCSKTRSSNLSADRNQLLIPVPTILVVVGITFIFPFSAACGQHQRGKWGYGGVWLDRYDLRNTRMLLFYYLCVASLLLLHVTLSLWKCIRAQFKYQPDTYNHPNYMSRYYTKIDQKHVTLAVLPLSENWVKFEVRKMTKIECFFCKKPGKSENIPLFCQKTPQNDQILL